MSKQLTLQDIEEYLSNLRERGNVSTNEDSYRNLISCINSTREYLYSLEESSDLRNEVSFCLSEMCKLIPSCKTKDFHQKVYTIIEAAEELNVSTKTIARWRTQGLESFKSVGSDGRLRVGILEKDLSDFRIRHAVKAAKGNNFSQLHGLEKVNILVSSRREVSEGTCPAEVTKKVAQDFNRSVETVRYIIKEHDLLNPTCKIFHKITDPLSPQERDHVFELWTEGMDESELSSCFCRSKSLIRDIIVEKRLNRLACSISPLREVANHDEYDSFCLLPEDFVWSPEFEDMDESEILKGVTPKGQKSPKPPKDMSTASMDFYIKSLYQTPMLDNESTNHLFRKMNYLKWSIHTCLKDICSAEYVKVSNKDMSFLESLGEQAKDVKNLLVSSNLRLVVSIARRHIETEDLFSLISDGNISLMRAVDKFDFTIGTRFSTYATAAISKNYSRTIPKELKTREKFRPTCDEVFQLKEDTRADIIEVDTNMEHVNKIVRSLTNLLDTRELEIITLRFGLDYSKEPMTLKEVGSEVGLTKERVRQIAESAIEKMRRVGTALELDDF